MSTFLGEGHIYDKYPNRWRFDPNYPHTVSEEELEKFEIKYQLNLPPEFKIFYLYFNGCVFHYDKFERIKYEFHKISMFLNKKKQNYKYLY